MLATRVAALLVAATLGGSVARAAPDEARSVVVMPLKTDSIRPGAVAALNELLAVSMSQLSGYRVVTPDDVEAQLGRANMKQVLGCDAASCAAEIGGALGTRYLLAGSARRLGGKILVTLSLIDTTDQVTRRGKMLVEDNEERYADAVDSAVREVLGLTATPAAAPALVATPVAPTDEVKPEMVVVPAGEFVMGCDPAHVEAALQARAEPRLSLRQAGHDALSTGTRGEDAQGLSFRELRPRGG